MLGQRDHVLGKQAQPVDVVARRATARLSGVSRSGSPRGILGLLRLALRDVPVLAVQAAEPAAGRGQREDVGAGQEVEQRLLLDRVDVEAHRIAVGQRVERAVLVDAVAAVAAVFRLQQALVGAELALDVLAQLQVVPRLLRPSRAACHSSQSLPLGASFWKTSADSAARGQRPGTPRTDGSTAAPPSAEARQAAQAVLQDLAACGCLRLRAVRRRRSLRRGSGRRGLAS